MMLVALAKQRIVLALLAEGNDYARSARGDSLTLGRRGLCSLRSQRRGLCSLRLAGTRCARRDSLALGRDVLAALAKEKNMLAGARVLTVYPALVRLPGLPRDPTRNGVLSGPMIAVFVHRVT